MCGALIVTAELGAADQAWLDRLRRTHYPPERNILPAHLTMFHALPPSLENEARRRLAALSGEPPPTASIEGVMNLGGGTALRVVSPQLDALREALASGFHGVLSAQDSGGWRPHVTIQNKVSAAIAATLQQEIEHAFRPVELVISGLGLHRYLGGPWDKVAIFKFRGAGPRGRPR